MATHQNNPQKEGKFYYVIEKAIEVVVFGLIVYFIQAYFAPITAAQTLIKENYVNSKTDAYYKAMDIVTREFAQLKIISQKLKSYPDDSLFVRIKGSVAPTEYEVNSCLAKLYLYTDNKNIIEPFKKLCSIEQNELWNNILSWQETFLTNIKIDLANDKKLKVDKYEYIVVRTDTTAH